MGYINLKNTSEFSITKSINTIPDIVEKAKKDGMNALALTDFNSMHGAVDFYRACRKAGIKPIIGLNATIEQEDGNKYQLTLLAKNNDGYKSLIHLNSRSHIENRDGDDVAIKEEWLAHLSNVIVLSGGKQGLIGQLILDGNQEEAVEVASRMNAYFGEDFFLELERDGTPDETPYMDGMIDIIQKLNIPAVATHNNYFLEPDDFLAHEARYCIANKLSLYDIKRERPFNKEMHFKTKQEMQELFLDLPTALSNTQKIAQKCNLEIELNHNYLPNFKTPNNESVNDYFAEQARIGLEQRLIEDYPDDQERDRQYNTYKQRLEHEIQVIQNMEFPGYFLIVADFINWAKQHDIPVGPGRGSGAGSLVAYSMHITDIDPIPYNLLFERFLNPDRVSMPDFDIDFCQSRRNEVYNYVRRKYGEQAVAQIGTFGTMASRSVVRDVGRTLNLNYNFVDSIVKGINIHPASPMKLKDYIFGNKEKGIPADEKLLTRYQSEESVKKLFDIAFKLEGLTRQLGTHAAGVVIAPTKIIDFCPLATIDKNSPPITQFSMSNVEAVGLVKFDFLGLRNLTIIKETIDLVNENSDQKLSLSKIDLNDSKVYDNIFANGNTTSIFQFEGAGMTNVLKQAKPNSLEDLIAITSLYRPGPMDIIPDWLLARKLPKDEISYLHPKLKDVLNETHGFFVYQEQVMQCAQVIAGYTLGQADLLRRAMGKKRPEEMAVQRAIFTEGAKKNGVDEKVASDIFDLMEKFAAYGFNKSHAAAYSLLSFQTAYLKHYHTEEFFVATLNSQIDNTDKLAFLIEDANRNNIEILPPDINLSLYEFRKSGDGQIRYSLGALKGVGEKAAAAIVKARSEKGQFTDFYDFLEKAGGGQVNKRVIESLIRAGAFDSLHENRAQLFNSVREGLDYISKYRKNETKGTSVLPQEVFKKSSVKLKKTENTKDQLERPELTTDFEDWTDMEKLKAEKQSIGFYFSSNPYYMMKKKLGGVKAATKIADLEDFFNHGQSETFIAGVIEELRIWKSQKGAFVTINDGTQSAKVMVFSDFLDKNKDWLKEDVFISFKCRKNEKFSESGDEIILNATDGYNYADTEKLLARRISVAGQNNTEDIKAFDNICKPHLAKNNTLDVTLFLPSQSNTSKYEAAKTVKISRDKYEEVLAKMTREFGNNKTVTQFYEDQKQIINERPKQQNRNGNFYSSYTGQNSRQ